MESTEPPFLWLQVRSLDSAKIHPDILQPGPQAQNAALWEGWAASISTREVVSSTPVMYKLDKCQRMMRILEVMV